MQRDVTTTARRFPFAPAIETARSMEWNGMEWNRMEWNGVEWSGMEWNGMEWNGMEWNGMEWYGNPILSLSKRTENPGLTSEYTILIVM